MKSKSTFVVSRCTSAWRDVLTISIDHETGQVTDKTRSLGLVVLRGTALTVINPADGFEQIAKYVFYLHIMVSSHVHSPFLAPE